MPDHTNQIIQEVDIMIHEINEIVSLVSTGPIGTNTYILKNSPVIVIDPGFGIGHHLKEECVVLLTHSHYDHICGLNEIKVTKVYVSEEDLQGLGDPSVNKSSFFGNSFVYDGPFDIFQDTLTIGKWHFDVIRTPGHTKGSVVLSTDGMFFTGDTIFMDSIGRTDFPESDEKKMVESIKMLLNIFKKVDPDLLVLPGHMEWGKVKELLKRNYFLREALI